MVVLRSWNNSDHRDLCKTRDMATSGRGIPGTEPDTRGWNGQGAERTKGGTVGKRYGVVREISSSWSATTSVRHTRSTMRIRRGDRVFDTESLPAVYVCSVYPGDERNTSLYLPVCPRGWHLRPGVLMSLFSLSTCLQSYLLSIIRVM